MVPSPVVRTEGTTTYYKGLKSQNNPPQSKTMPMPDNVENTSSGPLICTIYYTGQHAKTLITRITKTVRDREKLNTYLESASKMLSRTPIRMLDEKTLLTSVIFVVVLDLFFCTFFLIGWFKIQRF